MTEEDYEFFMVYELDDSGERVRLYVTEEEFRENNGMNVLHPEQVCVICKEEIRRIFIWKGAKSPVRKRFISSRIASELQEELQKVAAFHRCKIVSVDQGDEVQEFLRAFRFTSMEVDEKLADMRYIRNIDRDRMLDEGTFPEEQPKTVKVEKKVNQGSVATRAPPRPSTRSTPIKRGKSQGTYSSKPLSSSRSAPGLSNDKVKEIMKRILDNETPAGYKRLNLIMGHTLYGAVSKTTEVFGETHVETEWEQVKKLPSGPIEIDEKKLRIYLDEEKGIVEAVEILDVIGGAGKKTASVKAASKKTASSVNYNSWSVKDLKSHCSDNGIKFPKSAKKADLIKLIKKAEQPKSSGRRALPKIPKS